MGHDHQASGQARPRRCLTDKMTKGTNTGKPILRVVSSKPADDPLFADYGPVGAAPPSAPSAPSAPSTPPAWQDITPIDDGGSYATRIGADRVGLVGEVLAETTLAWRIETPNAEPAWLPKSQCEHHGEDPRGRTILVLPAWLARRAGLL